MSERSNPVEINLDGVEPSGAALVAKRRWGDTYACFT